MIRGVLDEARIPYFVCFGTALFSLRDAHRPYQTIPWEHDLDVCIQWQVRVLATCWPRGSRVLAVCWPSARWPCAG